MEYINKLEKVVLGWAKDVPHLPVVARKWLGTNVWWIVLICAILSGISFLISVSNLFNQLSLLNAPSNAYYVTSDYTSIAILHIVVSAVFILVSGLLLALAVQPLQNKEKKGWVLLFVTLILEALSVVVNSVLTFSVVGFVLGILFGAIALAIVAYFVFEIHDQFGRREKTIHTDA